MLAGLDDQRKINRIGAVIGRTRRRVIREGAAETILRGDIDELSSTGKSIMPEGLEKQISPQEMADLLAFLQSDQR